MLKCFRAVVEEPIAVVVGQAAQASDAVQAEVFSLKQRLTEEAAKYTAEIERLKQRLEIAESCAKAEIMHMRLTYQEDLNEKNSEIKSLKLKLRHILNKTEIRWLKKCKCQMTKLTAFKAQLRKIIDIKCSQIKIAANTV